MKTKYLVLLDKLLLLISVQKPLGLKDITNLAIKVPLNIKVAEVKSKIPDDITNLATKAALNKKVTDSKQNT